RQTGADRHDAPARRRVALHSTRRRRQVHTGSIGRGAVGGERQACRREAHGAEGSEGPWRLICCCGRAASSWQTAYGIRSCAAPHVITAAHGGAAISSVSSPPWRRWRKPSRSYKPDSGEGGHPSWTIVTDRL